MNFKIVVMDCPYDQWESSEVQDLFIKNTHLKFRGYKKEYPYGVLPVDTTDFVGIHHILCVDYGKNQLQPIMAYRSIYLDRCDIHNLALPALNMVKSLSLVDHVQAVDEVIQNCRKRKLKLSYDSSWTIDPEIRADKKLTSEVRNIMNSMHVLFHTEAETDQILSGGVLKFKMDHLFTSWGYEPISLGKDKLSSFELPMVFNEKIILFHQKHGFPKDAVDMANNYRRLWNERIVLAKIDKNEEVQIAA